MVSNWEQVMIPNKDDIIKIAEFFDFPMDCLINDEIRLDDRKKSSEVKINTSKEGKVKLPDNWISISMIDFIYICTFLGSRLVNRNYS